MRVVAGAPNALREACRESRCTCVLRETPQNRYEHNVHRLPAAGEREPSLANPLSFSLYVCVGLQASWMITWCQWEKRRWNMKRSWTCMMKRKPVFQAGQAPPRGGSATPKLWAHQNFCRKTKKKSWVGGVTLLCNRMFFVFVFFCFVFF